MRKINTRFEKYKLNSACTGPATQAVFSALGTTFAAPLEAASNIVGISAGIWFRLIKRKTFKGIDMVKGRGSYVKPELLPLLYLTLVQLWWNFESPVFKRLGASWNIIISLCISTLCFIFYRHIVSNPIRYASIFNLENIDAPQWFKDALQISRIVMFNLVFFFVWYKDLYGMSNFRYVFCLYTVFWCFYCWQEQLTGIKKSIINNLTTK